MFRENLLSDNFQQSYQNRIALAGSLAASFPGHGDRVAFQLLGLAGLVDAIKLSFPGAEVKAVRRPQAELEDDFDFLSDGVIE